MCPIRNGWVPLSDGSPTVALEHASEWVRMCHRPMYGWLAQLVDTAGSFPTALLLGAKGVPTSRQRHPFAGGSGCCLPEV